jgi:DNA-binding transcriptional MerR regulator
MGLFMGTSVPPEAHYRSSGVGSVAAVPSFTPAETASRSGFTIETLRYYEHIGLLRDIERNASGHRVFRTDDLDWLAVLRCLRDTGMPIAAMRRYAEHAQADTAHTIPERLALLEAHERTVRANIALMEGQRQPWSRRSPTPRDRLRRPGAADCHRFVDPRRRRALEG